MNNRNNVAQVEREPLLPDRSGNSGYRAIADSIELLANFQTSWKRKARAWFYAPITAGVLLISAIIFVLVHVGRLYDRTCTSPEALNKFNNSTGIWPADYPPDPSSLPANDTCGTYFNIYTLCEKNSLMFGSGVAWDCTNAAIRYLLNNGSLENYNRLEPDTFIFPNKTCGDLYPISSLSNFYQIVGYANIVCQTLFDELFKELNSVAKATSKTKNIIEICFGILLAVTILALIANSLKRGHSLFLTKPSINSLPNDDANNIMQLSDRMAVNMEAGMSIDRAISVLKSKELQISKPLITKLLLFGMKDQGSSLYMLKGNKDMIRLLLNYSGLYKYPGPKLHAESLPAVTEMQELKVQMLSMTRI